VDDAPEALGLVEREVMSLVARILGGGERREGGPTEAPAAERPVAKELAGAAGRPRLRPSCRPQKSPKILSELP
jgi:hypothetical protein